jgi:hypothetical protein
MPPRRLFSRRTRGIQSPSAKSNDSFPNRRSNRPSTSAHPEPPTPPQPSYPDYLNENATPGWDAALVMSSIIRDMPALPRTVSAPLSQVFDVAGEVIEAVKTMRDGRDGCTQLIVRVTKFLESFVDGLKGSNILDNMTIASSLFILKRYASQFPRTISTMKCMSFGYRNLMAICADAKRWSSLNLLSRYVQRDQIMSAISRHEVNLTDCFHAFQVSVYSRGPLSLCKNELMSS